MEDKIKYKKYPQIDLEKSFNKTSQYKTPHSIQSININNYEEEYLLDSKIYISEYDNNNLDIYIGKTKSDVIIRILYYEIIISPNNFSLLIKKKFQSIDELYEFIKDIFANKKYEIKGEKENIMRIKLFIKDNEINKYKEIVLSLKENFGNYKYFIKNLFNKYIKLEKEMNEIKTINLYIKNENSMLKNENQNLRNDFESLKNQYNNDISNLKFQMMNLMNIMNNNINYNNNYNSLNTNFNNLNINEFNNNNEPAPINIIFKERETGTSINILCNNNDLISTIINKFKLKKGINFKEKKYKFIHNGKELKKHLTVKQQGLGELDPVIVTEINSF